ncbi:MAG: efflux RND transporter periplasmic adaptor subunit [Candidatus Zixiibacteriota bacterium]
MKRPPIKGRTLALVGVLVPLLALFIYVVLRSGPLAPVLVTVAVVEDSSITPALFGIGTVEAQYTYKIGPTIAGRVKRVDVQVGDRVQVGQVLGEMEPVDLDDRVVSQEAALRRAEAAVLAFEAQVREVSARRENAATLANRYEQLFQSGGLSEEEIEGRRLEYQVAEANHALARANLDAARQDVERNRSDRDGLLRQRANLKLVAPVDGLVASRNADPGTTVIAGQAVVEIIDPNSLWINVRFDQLSSGGLHSGQRARIVLRSQSKSDINGRVLRVEPLADAVTEEILSKVVFDLAPEPLPPLGELAEVTVALTALPTSPTVPNASLQRVDGRLGVWLIADGDLRFAEVKMGASDLDGQVQILEGLKAGELVVVYSQRELRAQSRIKIVERLPGVSQ